MDYDAEVWAKEAAFSLFIIVLDTLRQGEMDIDAAQGQPACPNAKSVRVKLGVELWTS